MSENARVEATFPSIINQVEEQHFARVSFPLSYKELSHAADTYFSFLSLPQEIKDSFGKTAGHEHNYGLTGYKRRSKDGGYDEKEFFHYHPSVENYIEENPHKNVPEVKLFLDQARRVDEAATETLHTVLKEISNEFPNILNEYFPEHEARRTLVRFLKYSIAGKGNFLARAHYDAGGCTLALAESAPGLRLGSTADNLTAVEHVEHTALFMPALYFNVVTDDRFLPVWHDVVQTSENTFSNEAARWAIVFFADGVSQKERPSSEEVFTPRNY